MAYQINLTGQEIDERLQNIGTDKDVAAADGSLYARISKNADDVDELRDTVGHIDSAQNATDKTVTQHTADISTLQTALKKKANLVLGKVSVNELPVATSLGNPNNGTIPSTFAVSKAINDKIVGLLNWQGVKATTAEIKEIASAKKGDVWHSNGDGSEWVCTQDITAANADAWTELGTPIDLSGYYTKNEVDKKVKPLADSIGTNRDAASVNGSVYARIKKNQVDIADIGSRQTNIEEVVSGAQSDAYFTLKWFNLVFNDSRFNIDNVKVRLYRWSGKRYAQFVMFTQNSTGVSQKSINYEIILKQEQKDGANVRMPYIHYNDDGTEKELWFAIKDAFGGRISYNRYKKRRWRIQAFLNDKPITAPFDFRVSIGNGPNSVTKGGMMRSVPRSSDVVYDGCFSGESWLAHKKGSQFDIDFFNEPIIRRFPMPGDPVSSTGETYGAVVAVKEIPTATSVTYNILWTNGIALYEIGVLEQDGVLSYICSSPAKKLCDDIYNYASKMNSGTLRDLYISAGAVYNEATGYYELNGLTDITEEEMRVIWQEDLSGWYLNGRTNLTRNISTRGSSGGYNGGIDTCSMCAGNKNITIFSFGQPPLVHYLDNTFSGCTKLETIDTRFPIHPYGGVVGPNVFRECSALKEVRFNMRYINYSVSVIFPASPLISKGSVLSIIKTTNAEGSVKPLVVVGLNEAAYNRLKDDTDITAALTEKNGFVTITQI